MKVRYGRQNRDKKDRTAIVQVAF